MLWINTLFDWVKTKNSSGAFNAALITYSSPFCKHGNNSRKCDTGGIVAANLIAGKVTTARKWFFKINIKRAFFAF